jgi:hypothetical protein
MKSPFDECAGIVRQKAPAAESFEGVFYRGDKRKISHGDTETQRDEEE